MRLVATSQMAAYPDGGGKATIAALNGRIFESAACKTMTGGQTQGDGNDQSMTLYQSRTKANLVVPLCSSHSALFPALSRDRCPSGRGRSSFHDVQGCWRQACALCQMPRIMLQPRSRAKSGVAVPGGAEFSRLWEGLSSYEDDQ